MREEKRILEIACFGLAAAKIAQEAGADRIELCIDKTAGGISPDFDLITQARQIIHIPLYVMIRPRAGDFVYTSQEIGNMLDTIAFCKQIGIDGCVWGVLDASGNIDFAVNQELMQAANGLSCTFHRAFDGIEDKTTALQQLIELGFEQVLTAGGVGNAEEFTDMLSSLIQQAENKIVVMPGGGIRSTNLPALHAKVQAKAYHSAAIIDGEVPDSEEIKKMCRLIQA